MAKKNNPEQRTVRTESEETNEVTSQPTGDEVFESAAPEAAGTSGTTGATSQEENRTQAERMASDYIKNINEVATRYYEKLTETAENLSKQVQKLGETGGQYAREYPGSMLGTGFIVGVLIGFLTTRS